jgi:hypothetical protein
MKNMKRKRNREGRRVTRKGKKEEEKKTEPWLAIQTCHGILKLFLLQSCSEKTAMPALGYFFVLSTLGKKKKNTSAEHQLLGVGPDQTKKYNSTND